MNKEIIIFDFDGTLADSLSFIYDCLSEVLSEEEDIEISRNEFKKLKKEGVLEALRELEVPFYKFPILYLKTKNRMEERVTEVNLYGGVENLLTELKRRELTIGIVSNNKKSTVEDFLRNENLDYFDFVVGSFFFSNKSARLTEVVKEKGKKAIYIGDQVGDIKAANQAEIDSIAVSWGFDAKEELEKENPTYLVSNVDELYNLLIK